MCPITLRLSSLRLKFKRHIKYAEIIFFILSAKLSGATDERIVETNIMPV